MRNERLTFQSIQNVKIRKSQGCNMIPLQTEVKYTGSRKFLAAWWPLFEGPADSKRGPRVISRKMSFSIFGIRNPPAPRRGATKLRGISTILYPGSSVLMRSYCSLAFFRIFVICILVFSYLFIPAGLMLYFAC